MKALKFIILIAILLQGFNLTARTNSNVSNNKKATIYIVRTSGAGAIINFKYFLNDKYIGKFNYGKYLKLEVEPGEYLIWATSENKSFVEANVEAGKTYIINSMPVLGAFKARVKLLPVDNQNDKILVRVKKYITKKSLIEFDNETLKKGQKSSAEWIKKNLRSYELNKKGKKSVEKLTESIDLDKIDITKKRKKRRK